MCSAERFITACAFVDKVNAGKKRQDPETEVRDQPCDLVYQGQVP
jgi:hypothetical protein